MVAQARLFPKRIGTVNSRPDQSESSDSGQGEQISNSPLNIRGFCCPKGAALVGPAEGPRRAKQRKTVAIHKEAEPETLASQQEDGQQEQLGRPGGQSFP